MQASTYMRDRLLLARDLLAPTGSAPSTWRSVTDYVTHPTDVPAAIDKALARAP